MLRSSSSEDDYDEDDQRVEPDDVIDYNYPRRSPSVQQHSGHPVASPRTSNQSHYSQHHSSNRDSIGSAGYGSHGYQQHYNSATTKSNHSGSSGSPASTSRAPSFDNTKHQGSSFDTVSISSGLSVPPASYDTRSHDGSAHNTPSRHDRQHSGGHSRSNSFRSADRSPQPMRRSASPTSSIISDREREEVARLNVEEEERKRRLQIYVFVLRCIAFPFNAKQKPPPQNSYKRQAKMSKQEHTRIKERFAAFLNGEIEMLADDALRNAVQSYYEVFLKSDRVASMVRFGACSENDFREVFKNNIEKRVRSLPAINGLSKETVLSSWMTKFDAIYRGDEDESKKMQRSSTTANELILSKDQLYEMFQNIFNIRKYEHLILYNALQVRKVNACLLKVVSPC